MKRALLTLLLVLPFASIVGCDSTSNTATTQIINEMQWLPDGSGLLAVVVNSSIDVTTGNQSYEAGFYRVRGDGSIGDRISIPDKGLPSSYPTPINISKDGRTAITELGTTVYRIDVPSGNATALIRNEYFLGASNSLKYALVTETNSALFTRFATLYDISGATPRKVKDFTMNGVKGVRAIWMGDTAFAFWGNDSTYHDETQIYDTTGRVTHVFSDVVVADLKSAYAPLANALYLYNVARGIDKIDLTTATQTTVLSGDSIEYMDVTPSGNLIAYSSGGGVSPFALYALNPATGARKNIATNAYEVALAPAGDKVAYSGISSGIAGVGIHVIPVSIP